MPTTHEFKEKTSKRRYIWGACSSVCVGGGIVAAILGLKSKNKK